MHMAVKLAHRLWPDRLMRNSLHCSEDGSSKLLDKYIGQHRLQLREQRISLSQHELCLIEPADVDAVMDMYISAGNT